MKFYKSDIKVSIVMAAILMFLAAVVIIKIRRPDDLKNENRTVWKDGRQIQLEEEQWKRIESAVMDSIIPGFELDTMWSEEQIAGMHEKGLLIECSAPEGLDNDNRTLLKYIVISNEQYQYLIILTDKGSETYDLSEIAQTKLREIISD